MYTKEILEKLESYKTNDENNDPTLFLKMSPEHQKELLKLIKEYLRPIKSFNEQCTSYGLKHYFEKLTSFGYICNGEMKGALIVSGFKVNPKNKYSINHDYNISAKSLNKLRDIVRQK